MHVHHVCAYHHPLIIPTHLTPPPTPHIPPTEHHYPPIIHTHLTPCQPPLIPTHLIHHQPLIHHLSNTTTHSPYATNLTPPPPLLLPNTTSNPQIIKHLCLCILIANVMSNTGIYKKVTHRANPSVFRCKYQSRLASVWMQVPLCGEHTLNLPLSIFSWKWRISETIYICTETDVN